MTASRVAVRAAPWGTHIELCAPQVRNALDAEAVEDLAQAFSHAREGAVLLSGQGRVFCAGGDVTTLAQAIEQDRLEELLVSAGGRFADLVDVIVGCPSPVVCALQGAAVGGGLSLALACDVRVAGASARLVPGWGRWGLPPDGCASALLAAAVGVAAATAVLVRGLPVTTDSPLAPLLFSEVVEDDRVVAVATGLAQQLASQGAARAKAVAVPLRRRTLQEQREVELEVLRSAAADPAVRAALMSAGAGSLAARGGPVGCA